MDVLSFKKPEAYRNTHTSEFREYDYDVDDVTNKFDSIHFDNDSYNSDDDYDNDNDNHDRDSNNNCIIL